MLFWLIKSEVLTKDNKLKQNNLLGSTIINHYSMEIFNPRVM